MVAPVKPKASQSVHIVKCKQSSRHRFMYSDKDQYCVCIAGVPYFWKTDNTRLIVFSSPWFQRWIVFQQKWKSGSFFAEISSSVVKKCRSSPVWCHPIRQKPTIILSSTDEITSIIELGQSADPDWTLFLSTSCCLQPRWEPESPWRRWWSWPLGCWPPFSWPPS